MKLKERMSNVNKSMLKVTGSALITLATGDGEMSMEDGIKLLVEARE